MDIDRCIDSVVNEVKRDKTRASGGDFCQNQEQKTGKIDFQQMTLAELCESEILSEDIKIEIYKRIRQDAEIYIESFVDSPRCKRR